MSSHHELVALRRSSLLLRSLPILPVSRRAPRGGEEVEDTLNSLAGKLLKLDLAKEHKESLVRSLSVGARRRCGSGLLMP